MKLTSSELGDELRNGSDEYLTRRRRTASLAVVSIASLSIVALYQLGILKHLPKSPMRGLDAEKINGSGEAYGMLQTPDAVLGIGSYAVTLGLAAMGDADRSETHPWIPLALAAKVGLDTLLAGALTRKSWADFRGFSPYSLVTVLATFLALPAILPEARAALGTLLRKR